MNNNDIVNIPNHIAANEPCLEKGPNGQLCDYHRGFHTAIARVTASLATKVRENV